MISDAWFWVNAQVMKAVGQLEVCLSAFGLGQQFSHRSVHEPQDLGTDAFIYSVQWAFDPCSTSGGGKTTLQAH